MAEAKPAVPTELRLATNRKKAAMKDTKNTAAGSLHVISLTSPPGTESNAIIQCENGGLDGTAPS
jgi:hypothetical protein